MGENKYDKLKKVKINVNVESKNKSNVNQPRINKRKSFFQRYSNFVGIKNLEKIDDIDVKRKSSFEKKEEDIQSKMSQSKKSDFMLNQITQNIIDGDKNLNNPEIFYNEMFKNIVVNSSSCTPKVKNKSKSTKKHSKIKNFTSMRKSLISNEDNSNT